MGLGANARHATCMAVTIHVFLEVRTMVIRTIPILFGLFLVGSAFAQDKELPPLEANLKVQFVEGQTVAAMGGKAPLEAHFLTPSSKEQKFTNTEYRIALLDKNGEQVKGAIAVTTELRDIALKAPATVDRPGVSIVPGKLKAGEDYFLVVSVRNLIGHVKFTAK